MIPTDDQAKALWQKYHLPENKRLHVSLVAEVSVFLARRVMDITHVHIDVPLLRAAALLHDIDKAAARLPGESHPDTGVRILKEEGMVEVAKLVSTHPLHAILDPRIAPATWEEKLLYLSDKMVKYEIITVDKRFALWNGEHLPVNQQEILHTSYPKVKALEADVFRIIDMMPAKVADLIKVGYT